LEIGTNEIPIIDFNAMKRSSAAFDEPAARQWYRSFAMAASQ
jgi:hypothetical protein